MILDKHGWLQKQSTWEAEYPTSPNCTGVHLNAFPFSHDISSHLTMEIWLWWSRYLCHWIQSRLAVWWLIRSIFIFRRVVFFSSTHTQRWEHPLYYQTNFLIHHIVFDHFSVPYLICVFCHFLVSAFFSSFCILFLFPWFSALVALYVCLWLTLVSFCQPFFIRYNWYNNQIFK